MKDKQIHYELIYHCCDINNYRKMADACLDALAEYPDDDGFKYDLACAHFMGNAEMDVDFDKTMSLLNELEGTSVPEEDILDLKGRIFEFKGDYKKA